MLALAIQQPEEGEEFDWRSYAMCDGVAYDYDSEHHPFFGEGHGATYDGVRPYCASCPVVVDCLIYIIDDRTAVGFWGGTSPNERASIRRHIDNGSSFIDAVERVWNRNRRKFLPVPPKSIWKDWE